MAPRAKTVFKAYRRIHKWYTALTGEALSVRRDKFFNPRPPKNAEDVARAMQKWEFGHRGLKAYDPSIAHTPTWMFANALKKFVIGAFATEIFAPQTRWVGEGKLEDEQVVETRSPMCDWSTQDSLQARSPKDGSLGKINGDDQWYGYHYGNSFDWYDTDEHYLDENWGDDNGHARLLR